MIVKSISIAVIVLCFVSAILLGSSFTSFIDIQALWFVVVPVIFLFGVGSKRKEKMTGLIKGRGISWLELVGYLAVILGVIGSHMGMVIILHKLGDKAPIGPAFSFLTLTSFYGILVFLFSFLFGQHKLKKVAVYFVLGQVLILMLNFLSMLYFGQ